VSNVNCNRPTSVSAVCLKSPIQQAIIRQAATKEIFNAIDSQGQAS